MNQRQHEQASLVAKWSIVALGVMLTAIVSLTFATVREAANKSEHALDQNGGQDKSIALLAQQTEAIKETSKANVIALQSITLQMQRLSDKQEHLQSTQNRILKRIRP